MPISSGGPVASSSATRPKAQEIGLTGSAAPTQPSSLIGRYVMATAEHREPCESTGSCTVLGAPGGESPSGDSSSAGQRHLRGLARCGPDPEQGAGHALRGPRPRPAAKALETLLRL